MCCRLWLERELSITRLAATVAAAKVLTTAPVYFQTVEIARPI
jgi:hypothetical protein